MQRTQIHTTAMARASRHAIIAFCTLFINSVLWPTQLAEARNSFARRRDLGEHRCGEGTPRKASAVKTLKRTYVTAVVFAERGRPFRIAISPKKSPQAGSASGVSLPAESEDGFGPEPTERRTWSHRHHPDETATNRRAPSEP
jgi:hypothetical protein